VRPARSGRTRPQWLLAMVTFSGTLAMHVFVPALPMAAKDLGVGIATMQMTVASTSSVWPWRPTCTELAGIGSNPALAAALVLSVAGIVAQLSFWIATRR
jgi:hypothetical protein